MTVACHTGLFAGPWLRAAVVALNYSSPCSAPAAPLPAPCRCGRRWNLGGQSRRPALQQINAGDTWPRGLPAAAGGCRRPPWGSRRRRCRQQPAVFVAVLSRAHRAPARPRPVLPPLISVTDCYRLTFLLYNFEQTAYERLLPSAVGAHSGCGATRARPGVPTL